MKIITYNSAQYKETSIYETVKILVNFPPEDMTDDLREDLKRGSVPMLCFMTLDGRNMCVPVEFVISIEG